MHGHRLIHYIKELRWQAGMGLKESKDIIEAIRDGKSLETVMKMSAGLADRNKVNKAVRIVFHQMEQELWEESELSKTKLGKLIYV